MLFVKLITIILTVLAGGTEAFWRMTCHGRVGVGRIDPIVSPGVPSQHAHVLHGSSGLSFSSTYTDLINGNCTSCTVTQDKSGYWTPALYFQYPNGTLDLVNQVGGMTAYYQLFANGANDTILAFPEGFRMIAGDTTRRNCTIDGQPCVFPDPEKSFWAELNQTSQSILEQRAIGFNCLHYYLGDDGDDEPTLWRHFMPAKDFLDANCNDGLRLEVMFPSCWNGKDIDSPNHKSHMAYPDLVMDGDCPPGFDVKLPAMLFETIWDTYAYVGVDGQFVLANGDPTGYGYHGDFVMGWDESFLQSAVDTCTNSSGQLTDCALFDLQSDSDAATCFLQTPTAIALEIVSTNLPFLPGHVAIQSGPAPATFGPATESSVPSETPTVTAAQTPVVTDYLPVTTECYTSGGVVDEVIVEVPVVYVTETVDVTEIITATVQANARRSPRDIADDFRHAVSHVNHHRHGHGRHGIHALWH